MCSPGRFQGQDCSQLQDLEEMMEEVDAAKNQCQGGDKQGKQGEEYGRHCPDFK